MGASKIQSDHQLITEDVKSQITKSSGNSNIASASFSRNGKLGALYINITATADTTAGNDAFVGTVPSKCAARAGGSATGYSGNSLLVFYLNGSTLRVRVTGATFPNSWSCGTAINYLLAY